MRKTNVLYLHECRKMPYEEYEKLFNERDEYGRRFVLINRAFSILGEEYEWLYQNTEVDYIGWQIEQGKFNWEKYGWLVPQYCPQNFDADKFNWQEHSWAVAAYLPERFDPEKYNWEKHSATVACYCPEHIDPEKYNWKDFAYAIAQYCPLSLDPTKFYL